MVTLLLASIGLSPGPAMASATSQATLPPPMTSTFACTGVTRPCKTSELCTTLALSTPGIGVPHTRRQWPPPPHRLHFFDELRCHLGIELEMDAGLLRLPREVLDPYRDFLLRRSDDREVELSPSFADFSHRVTSCPRAAASRAASNPPGPPPTTSTRLRVAAGVSSVSFSRPNIGLTTQVMGRIFVCSPMHPRLQAVHGAMSSKRPALALLGNSGSASSARPITVTSALPFCRMSSAISALLIRPTTMTAH